MNVGGEPERDAEARAIAQKELKVENFQATCRLEPDAEHLTELAIEAPWWEIGKPFVVK